MLTCHVCASTEYAPTKSAQAHRRCNHCMRKLWSTHEPDHKKMVERIKEEMIVAYGGECKCCGEKDRLILELDHIHGDGYKDKVNGRRKGGAKNWFYQLRKDGWPKDKFQILCRNCNWAKHRLGNAFPVHRAKVQYTMTDLKDYACLSPQPK